MKEVRGMLQSRRNFFSAAASIVAASLWGAGTLAAQRQVPWGIPFPDRPFGDPLPDHRPTPDRQLKNNQERIEKDMKQLKAAVDDLQKEFDSHNTTNVLSMNAVRKTEEIEKLARQIRDLLRG
jgi:hypothetical protein